jgi:hypothetical protein
MRADRGMSAPLKVLGCHGRPGMLAIGISIQQPLACSSGWHTQCGLACGTGLYRTSSGGVATWPHVAFLCVVVIPQNRMSAKQRAYIIEVCRPAADSAVRLAPHVSLCMASTGSKWASIAMRMSLHVLGSINQLGTGQAEQM